MSAIGSLRHIVTSREDAMPSASAMNGRPHRALVAWLIAGLIVALPVPTGGQAPAGAPTPGPARPATSTNGLHAKPDRRTVRPAAAVRSPYHQKRAPQKRTVTGGVRGTFRHPLGLHEARSRKRAAHDAAAYRQWRRLILAANPSLRAARQARLLDGWQIRLIDGDTFRYGMERIRIRGINAPEVSESGGFEASQRLDLLLREGPVTIIPQAQDVYGRTVADVFVNDRNVADILTDEGYAKSR